MMIDLPSHDHYSTHLERHGDEWHALDQDVNPIDRFAGFLAHAGRSPLTIKTYRSHLRVFAAWFQSTNGEPMEPAKVTPIHLRQFQRFLVERRLLKPLSVNHSLKTLKVFLGWAVAAGIAPSLLVSDGDRPWSGPRPVPVERSSPRWLDRPEQNALLRAVERASRPRDFAFVRLLLNTGLRVQELCDLKWKDVVLSENEGLLIVRHRKEGKSRCVPLNDHALAALFALGYEQDAGILRGQRGPLSPRVIQWSLARYGTLAQIDALSPRVLRHTYCKNLIDAGVSLEQVAARAGHASLESTRRYCTPSRPELERAGGQRNCIA
jgi:site-specific recombinase XerD